MSVVWTEVKQTGTFLLPSSGATLLTVLAPKCPLCVMTVLGAIGFSSEASHGIAAFISLPLLLVPLLMLGKPCLAPRHTYDPQILCPPLPRLLAPLPIPL